MANAMIRIAFLALMGFGLNVLVKLTPAFYRPMTIGLALLALVALIALVVMDNQDKKQANWQRF